MKPLATTILAVLMAGPAFAQSTGAPPSKDPPPPATVSTMSEKNKQFLDAYLDAWEKRMQKIEGLETKIIFTDIDPGPPVTKTIRTGEAAILKPNYAKLLLKEQADPANTKKIMHFVADGKFLWEYNYGKKLALVEPLPKEGVGDNVMMAFLFMNKASELKKRFDLSIDVDDKDKHNDHYLHIQIRPKNKDDMQEFEKAELVLWKNNKDEKFADRWMLPARLWFQGANKTQAIWDFQNQTTKTHLMPADFKAPGFPDKEWTRDWRRPPGPSVIRTAAPGK